jgi:hypothetical protein
LLFGCSKSEPPTQQVAAQRTPCSDLLPHLRAAVLHVEPNAALVFDHMQPQLLAACVGDDWPDPLRQCIVTHAAEEIASHACDAHISDELAQKLIDRVAPGQHVSPGDFLQR